MPFIPVANTVQVELLYRWDAQSVETVLHYDAPDPTYPIHMDELAAFFVNWYDVTMQPLHTNQISLVGIKCTDLATDSAPVLEYSTGLPLVGGIAGDSMPNSVALTITKRTELRGRSYRGRIFHPGLAEGQVVGNTVGGSVVTNLLSAYTLLLAPVTTIGTWHMVVVSRQHNNVVLSAGVTTGVTRLSSDGIVDAQRRRLPGRGA